MPSQADSPSFVRAPRAVVTANGVALRISQFEVVQNGHKASSEFSVTLPLFDPRAPYDWIWWADETDVEISISIGFADINGNIGQLTQLIVGPVDAFDMAPLPSSLSHVGGGTSGALGSGVGSGGEGRTAHDTGSGASLVIRGRDYSGTLMDSPVSLNVAGQQVTTSTVAQAVIANTPQLTLDLSNVPDPVGDEYNDLQSRVVLHRSAWDILSALADHEGMRVLVQGRTVSIAPLPQQDAAAPYKIVYTPAQAATATTAFQPVTATVETLRLARALQVGKGIDHFVESYDSATGRLPRRARASSRSKRSKRAALTYTENQPGMSQKQARKHAGAKADQLSRLDREVEFRFPGDPALTIDSTVQLSGTGTAFDQTYTVDQITHWYSVVEGYTMEVRIRNRSADATVTTEDVANTKQDFSAGTAPQNPPSFERDEDGNITGYSPSNQE